MASHFVGLARGANGTQDDDFFFGVASNPSATIEVRIDDGAGYRTSEVKSQMEMFDKVFAERRLWAFFGFVLNG